MRIKERGFGPGTAKIESIVTLCLETMAKENAYIY
jgi:hypothetical protein